MKFSPRTWLILGILYICYIVYGTLIPFDFSFSFEVIQGNLGQIEGFEKYGRPYLSTKNIDVIANIFFFIPLGIIIYNIRYALGRKRKYVFDIILATVLGLFLSLTIELMQLLIEERRTSLVDILMNTLGSFSGALLGYFFTQILTKSVRQRIVSFIRKIPTAILLIPFLLFGLSITEKFSDRIFKFGKIEDIHFNWDYIFKPIWIWLILYVYIPVAILLTRTVKNRFSKSSVLVIYLISFISSMTMISIIEFIKYIGYSASEPFVNIFFAIIGIVIGIAFFEVLIKDRGGIDRGANRQNILLLTGVYIFLWIIILYKSAYPFEFNLSRSYMLDKTLFSLLSTYSFIPFTRFLKLSIYTVQNILLFLPVGIVLCEMESQLNNKKKIFLMVMSSILLIVILFIIKILNQNLTPFLYEIPTNVLGIFIGYFIWYGFTRENQKQ